MQQPISGRDVYAPLVSAVVNGAPVEVSSVQVDRGLPDPLVGGSLTAASASFTAVQGDDVVSTVATPWDPGTQWPPVPESPASVSMDTGAGPVSLMANGRVISASGGTSGREVDVEISDAYQTLDRPISWDAFADAMPALTEATTQRYVSLHASALTDRILRHCGWYATPPPVGYTALSVPAMGTMWPEAGVLQACIAQSAGSSFPAMFTEPWGKGVSDVNAVYSSTAAYSVKSRGRVEMTAIAGRKNGGTMHLVARTDSYRRLRLSWTDSTASVWVTDAAGNYASVASLPRGVGSFLYVTVEYLTDSTGRVTLRVDDQSTVVSVPIRTEILTESLTVFEISGDGVGGGFQVGFPSSAGGLTSWKPNAVIYDRSSMPNALQVVPAVEGENCADLLADQCAAQNATYWIDETGVLRWWDMARLESRSSAATLTSDDDIGEAGFTWSHELSSVKRSVSVKWREPLVEGGWRTNVDFWQGNGSTVDTTGAENPVEDWIKVPEDEVWLMPDLSLSRVGSVTGDDFNYGWGSWYGAVVQNAGNESWAHLHGSFLVSIERVNDNAFKYVTTWTGAAQAVQRTPQGAESASMWGIRRNFDLPILRGKKKYRVADRSYTAAQTGPATAPDHVIDAGWWVQNEAQAKIAADYAAARLTVPQPVLSSVALIPVPGLQLGDMVTVTDSHVTRLTIRGVVVEDSRSIDAGMGMSHVVAIRPVQVSRNGVTWAEWASVARPDTWQEWATSEGGTWAAWGSNPLNT